jgi:CTP:molybdopterin cytidylyltransferase MocA
VTVAAVILSATSEGALAPTQGQPRVRRLVDIAWAGGGLPVVVVSPDEDGRVAEALRGSEAVHGLPAPIEHGAAGQMLRGIDLAIAEVRETSAVLLWPARMTWVGPETVTSLIEAHGVEPLAILRPVWGDEPGWPVLLPIAHAPALRAAPPDAMPDAVVDGLVAALPTRLLDLGDPGTVFDAETPASDLPAYIGPTDPPAGHTHEWGDDVEAEAGLDVHEGAATRD